MGSFLAERLLGTCPGVEARRLVLSSCAPGYLCAWEQLRARKAADEHRPSEAIAGGNPMSVTFRPVVAGPPLEGECPSFSFAPVTHLLPDRREAKAYRTAPEHRGECTDADRASTAVLRSEQTPLWEFRLAGF